MPSNYYVKTSTKNFQSFTPLSPLLHSSTPRSATEIFLCLFKIFLLHYLVL